MMSNSLMKKIIVLALTALFLVSFFTPEAFAEATTHVINYGGLIYVDAAMYESGDELLIKTSDPVTITGTKNLRITVDTVSSDITLLNYTSEVSGCALNYTEGGINILRLSGTNILKSGTYNAGIRVPDETTLTIDEVEGFSGSLKATGAMYAPGIGSDLSPSGHIMIFGGTITAQGGSDGAGIGGGQYVDNGSVEIFGGTVIAKGGGYGAGIGGGSDNGKGGTVFIYGGNVTATGGDSGGPGIGGFGSLNFLMQDGVLTAKGNDTGAGIGGAFGRSGGVIQIIGGTVLATGGTDGAAGIGGGGGYGTGDVAGGSGGTISIKGGNVTAEGGGSVFAFDYLGGAGIGSGCYGSSGGTITIEGGVVTATGVKNAAGIGGGNECDGGIITIKGGIITATGGENAAGIGGGSEKGSGTVIINGGVINAKGGYRADGVGSGYYGSGGSIEIKSGELYADCGSSGSDISETANFSISGDSAVFVRDDSSLNPTFTDSPALHGYLDNEVVTDGSAYGYENFPSTWNGGTAYGWCAPCYTVTFYPNAGGDTVSSMPDDDNYLKGYMVIKPENPVRDGYRLEGWYKESSCVNKWIFLSDTITSDLSLYANWETNQKPNRIDGVPEIETATTRVGTTGEIDLLTIFEDADGDTLSYEVSIDGGENVSAARSYIYTPSEVGVKTFVFVAYDGAVYSDDTYTITITAVGEHTLTYLAGDNGSITGSSPQTVWYGENGTAVEAVADTGYHFAKWSDESTDNPRRDKNVTADIEVTALFEMSTYSLEYIAGANGTLNGETSQSVIHGGDGTQVEAVAGMGYHFAGWSDGETDNPRTDENVEDNISVTAQFAVNTYSLEYIAGANGSLLGNTTQSVNHGGNGTEVEAVPDTGYHFAGWSDGETDNPRTDENVEENISVTAQFEINTYSLEYIAGVNGSLTGDTSQSVNHGGDGTAVEAIAATGYHFAGWSDGKTANPRTDENVDDNISVTAQFEINTYSLEYIAGVNGSLTGDTTQSVNHGGDGTSVEAVAATGYHFAGWSDGNAANPRTDIYVTANIAVTAQFEINAYTLEYIAGVNGSLLGDTTQSVNHGGSGTQVDAVPDTGYHFIGWSDKETDNPRTDENVTGDISVTAEFAIDVYQAEYKAGDGGIIDGKAIQQVEYGRDTEKVEAVPDTGYHFVSWSDGAAEAARVDKSVAGDINVTAEFDVNYYNVVFEDYDGVVLKSVIVKHGDIAAPPDDPSHAGYTFAGWDKAFDNVTSDLSITAQYYVRYYKVDFMDYDNHVINSQYVAYGDSALAPADPEREGYLFAGWDTDYTNVQSNLLVYAKYIRQNYTVEFIDYEGSLLKSQTVQYGEDAEAPEPAEREGYEFTGWDLPYENVQSDLRVTAQYNELPKEEPLREEVPGDEPAEPVKVSDVRQNEDGEISVTVEMADAVIDRVEVSEGSAVIDEDGSLVITFDENTEPGDKTVTLYLSDGTVITRTITIPEAQIPLAPAAEENDEKQKSSLLWLWLLLLILIMLGIALVILQQTRNRRSR